MNSEELKELLDYIQENNSWEKMCDCLDRDRYFFKYIRISYDTRETTLGEHVWHIILDNGKDSKIYLRDKTLKECKDILDLPRREIVKLFEREDK
ncbi:MAG: hypothetical protein IJX99_06550 [Clostridia bacterium]|nr:hypothetical protein [Clostridia bacterium]